MLLLSLATSFTIPDAPAAMIAVLLLMHVITWAVAVGGLSVLAATGIAGGAALAVAADRDLPPSPRAGRP